MPLHGKIVVIKRSGGDGTEFPLTATCLFGRKVDCDIRIQLPQVSKEHCRIDLNENKQVILTNLSEVNPICVNGEVLKQSERLKHGDVITIIDRSFRFEYPPVQTPKKRSSRGKTETLKVLQDQQVGDSGIVETGDQKSAGPHLKDGTNIKRSLEKTLEMESREEGGQDQSKTISPFNDLYQMIKKSLDVKTPRKSSISLLQTPSSSFSCTKPTSFRKNDGNSIITDDGFTPSKAGVKVFVASQSVNGTPQSVKKQRRSSNISSTEVIATGVSEGAEFESTPPRRRSSLTPKSFTETIEQIAAHTPKSPVRRRSGESSSSKVVAAKEPDEAALKKGGSKKRKSGDLGTDLPNSKNKKKRVSFGDYLSPEFFDKRLPPDSPLRKGAAPRRSLSLLKPKLSLLRRASDIGMLKGRSKGDVSAPKSKPQSPKNTTSKTQPAKASPKATSPAKVSPKSATPKSKVSPKLATPKFKVSPKSKVSPKLATPKSKVSPKLATPKSKVCPKLATPKSKVSSKLATPKSKVSPKSATPKSKVSPKSATPKSKMSPKLATPKSKVSPKSATPKSKVSPKSATPKSKMSPKLATPKSKVSPKLATPKSKAATPKSKVSPKAATPKSKVSPKAATPKSKVSPKAATPKSRSSAKIENPSLKANLLKSPVTPGRATSNKSTPVASHKKCATPKREASPGLRSSLGSFPVSQDCSTMPETPLSRKAQTPTVKGRFSVSLIGTPSPVTEADSVTAPVLLDTTTPKIPIRRKSMKSTSKRTPHLSKSAKKVLQRNVSRASLKISNCWADVVKFGKPKAQVFATNSKLTQRKTIKAPSKIQLKTPARKLKGHASTGHADSPVTIVVGRAHKRAIAHCSGAVPRVVTNITLLKKNMKMDEDLTGISEMFKTPVNERRRKSMINGNKTAETPAGQPTSVTDPSVLDTPEEPGEMMVSPLSVAQSAAKGSKYNSEAVRRLLDGVKESGLSSDLPALEVSSDSNDLLPADMQLQAVTPTQKPEMPVSLTGVKRLMKTPRQKAVPVEDLRGKLLKTPKMKPEQQDCLSGVKRLMKTPIQKAEPVEDLCGSLLKTPKQKVEAEECLTGVKKIMKTPQQKPEQPECLSEIKNHLRTPVSDVEVNMKSDVEPLEHSAPLQQAEELKNPNLNDSPREFMTEVKRIMKTPQREPETPECFSGVKNLLMTPTVEADASDEQSTHLQQAEEQKTPNRRSSPQECLTGVERFMKTPKEKSAPVEDMVGVKRLMQTPKEKGTAVEENFGIKELMKSPRLRGTTPVEDFVGLKELMEEPIPSCKLIEKTEDEELVPIDNEDVVQDTENEVASEDHFKKPGEHASTSDCVETVSQCIAEENLCEEEPTVGNVEEHLLPKVEANIAKMDATTTESVPAKKPTRGRRAKIVESNVTQEEFEIPEIAAPVRARRGRKIEGPAPSGARQVTRGRKSSPSDEVEHSVEETAPPKVSPKQRRGRKAKKVSEDQMEEIKENTTETEKMSEQSPTDVKTDAPLNRDLVKAKRGRKKIQPDISVKDQDEPNVDTIKDAVEDFIEKKKVLVDMADNLSHTAETVCVPDAEKPDSDTKPVRGRRAKVLEPKEGNNTEEAVEMPAVSAPVRGRRGKKLEAAEPPAGKRNTRGRNTKSEESPADHPIVIQPGTSTFPEASKAIQEIKPQTEKAVIKPQRGGKPKQTTVEPEKSDCDQQVVAQAKIEQVETSTAESPADRPLETQPETSPETSKASQEIKPQTEKAVIKPQRGRKPKQTTVEPENSDCDQQVVAEAKIEQVETSTAKKTRKGRKAKIEPAGPNEITDATVVACTQPQPSVRRKRGRNAKLEEEEKPIVYDGKDSVSQEPAKKTRRTKDHYQDQELVEAPPAEETVPAVKSKRGGRQAGQNPESLAVVESNVQEVSEKSKRGRQPKKVSKEVNEHKPEIGEKKNDQPGLQIIQKKARGAQTSEKNKSSTAIPAKRARKTTTLPLEIGTETQTKRGRRAASKIIVDNAAVSTETSTCEETDESNREAKESKRCVRWRSDVQVFDIPKVTPVKATRGRKSKLDIESKSAVTETKSTEEENLSDKMMETQPVKRCRRGAKAAEKTTENGKINEGDHQKDAEQEMPPKPRRGRLAKK